MKICPSCRQTYPDDNLNFCLTDGSFLTTAPETEPKTILMDPPRITNQTNWGQQNYQPPTVFQNQQSIQNQPLNYPIQVTGQNQTLAIISLVLGVFGLLVFCCHGGIPLGIGALATGLIAMNQEKNDPAQYGGRGLAIGGIITGAIGLVFGFVYLIFAIIIR